MKKPGPGETVLSDAAPPIGTTNQPNSKVTPKQRRAVIAACLMASDLVVVLAAQFAATAITGFPPVRVLRSMFESMPPDLWPLAPFTVLTAMLLVSMSIEGLYDPDTLRWGSGELARTLRAVAGGIVFYVLLAFALGVFSQSRQWVLWTWLLATAFIVLDRLVTRDMLYRYSMRNVLARPTLIVGSNSEAADVVAALSDGDSGYEVVGYLSSQLKDQLSLDFVQPSADHLGSPREIVDTIRTHDVDTVIVVASAFNYEVMDRIIAELRGLDVNIRVATGLSNVLSSRVIVGHAGEVPMLGVKPVTLTRGQLLVKRAFDLLVAGLGLVLVAPVMAVLGAMIKLTSDGPVFYAQERIGRNGRSFKMLKFRSMVRGADSKRSQLSSDNQADGHVLFKMKDDPRITPVGRFMRRYSLDELPQLINVLRSEMSLVGPRPPLPSEVAYYDDRARRRLEVLPGITGLWQVSGRSDLTFDEMVDLDLFYIENWSPTLDASMVVRTVPAVLSSRGAY